MSRPTRAVLVALAAALVVGGCATPLPEPSPEPPPAEPQPALAVEQVERVLTDLRGVLDTADAAQDAALLEPRLTGPALTIRKAEYVLAPDDSTEGITPLPTDVQNVVVAATDEWPKVLMAVTEPPEDLRPPLLVTLVQNEPRAQYRLWSWVRLFPGIDVPATLQPVVGSAPVDPDADLVVPLADLTAAYVDVLTQGDESGYAALFPEDPLRTGIVQTKAGYTELVEGNGSLSETYQPVDGAPAAVTTADGGVLAVHAFTTTTVITLDDSTLTLGDETATLLGAETVEESLTITHLSTVAFHVPLAADGAQVTVLGAEHVPVEVSGE